MQASFHFNYDFATNPLTLVLIGIAIAAIVVIIWRLRR